MYCWGSTENGELGLGGLEVEQVLLPEFNDFGLSWNLKQIESGLTHTLFLSEEGLVYSCGNNDLGQLGHDKPNRRPEFVDALEGHTITQVAAGDQHSLALTSLGTVYSWGDNGFGQLGINSMAPLSSELKLVKTLAKKHVVQISSGANHSLALTLDNELYAWGQNSNGQLGLGHTDNPIREPHCIKVLFPVPLMLIKGGGQHSVAITRAGFLFTWGSNKYGQLGRPVNETSFNSTPKLVPNLTIYSEPFRYAALGENHTAVLDSCGKLWTFGHGKYGQLGHGNFEDSAIPRPVLDLVGSKVSQVACGRCHTLVYLPSQGQLYAFGQGMSGQLGVKTPQNRSLPHAVIGPWRAPSGRSISSIEESSDEKVSIFYIFAGGEASFVNVSKKNKVGLDFCLQCPYDLPAIVEVPKFDQMVSINEDDMIDEELFTYCETVFGSLGCWNGAFLKEGSSKQDHGLDFKLAQDSMDKLGRMTKEALLEIAAAGIEKATRDLPSKPLTPEALRGFVILPLWKGYSDVKNALQFQRPFAASLLALDTYSSITYKSWLHSLPIDYLHLLVNQFKKIVAYVIKSQKNSKEFRPLLKTPEEEASFLFSALKVLNLLYEENKGFHNKKFRIPYEEFYISEITENVDIMKDYFQWRNPAYNRRMGFSNSVCFCEFPFLFDSKAKTLLLRADARRQMQGAINEAVQQSNPFMFFMNPTEIQFLTLYIHRNQLVSDTICQIDKYDYYELKKPLKVQFIGEEAEDAGGVKKEFFLLLLKELLNPDYGMFVEYKETNTIWFREGALEVDSMYSLIGIVCGLAIYNFTIINLPFPIALYKKLLDEPVDLNDFAEMDPVHAKSLRNLLEYDEGNEEEVFCLNFAVTVDNFGETKVVPLKADGESIAVNSSNKEEYVNLLVDWYLNKSIEKQYRSFHTGFHRVCGGGVLKLFQPEELMALVTGNENYDWKEFRESTTYKGEYYAEHPTIQLFWNVFEELTQEQKKKFLMFLTGCDRIPILGMKAIKMIIESTADSSYLPVAHTCVAQLDLPKYGTKEKLRYKLLQAIQQSEGFGLV